MLKTSSELYLHALYRSNMTLFGLTTEPVKALPLEQAQGRALVMRSVLGYDTNTLKKDLMGVMAENLERSDMIWNGFSISPQELVRQYLGKPLAKEHVTLVSPEIRVPAFDTSLVRFERFSQREHDKLLDFDKIVGIYQKLYASLDPQAKSRHRR